VSVEGAKRRVVWGRGIPSHIMNEKIFEFDTLKWRVFEHSGYYFDKNGFLQYKEGGKILLDLLSKLTRGWGWPNSPLRIRQ